MGIVSVGLAYLYGREVGRQRGGGQEDSIPLSSYEDGPTLVPYEGTPRQAFVWLVFSPFIVIWRSRRLAVVGLLYLVLAWLTMMALVGPLILAVDSSGWWILLYLPLWVAFCGIAVVRAALTDPGEMRYSVATNQPEDSE